MFFWGAVVDVFMQHALTNIYGVGHHTAHRLCARLQIHDKCKVKHLNQAQTTGLASFLQNTTTAPQPVRVPLANLRYIPPPPSQLVVQPLFTNNKDKSKDKQSSLVKRARPDDPLKGLKIESELRSMMRENIAHQRMIGSYVGKRHAMGLPVRGQNTASNAKTARKLNRVERRN